MELEISLGKEDIRFFVNSAQSVSMERVFAFDKNGNGANGSVKINFIEEVIGRHEGKKVSYDELIIGSVGMRHAIEHAGAHLRGKPYTKRHAQRLLNSFDNKKKIEIDGTIVDYCFREELCEYLEASYEISVKNRTSNLSK